MFGRNQGVEMNSLLANLGAILFFTFAFCSVAVSAGPLFPNSVVSHDIDLITPEDPTVEASVEFVGIEEREMPDKRHDNLMDDSTFVFKLAFDDKTVVEVWAHSDFDSQEAAQRYVQFLTGPLGKLPKHMRQPLLHVVLHKGNEIAYSEHLGHFFVLYSDNILERKRQSDLEETVFHESVHATLDYRYANHADWLYAQQQDVEFITEYAKSKPRGEDLAESALFAFSLMNNPERMPPNVKTWLENNIPNRLRFLNGVLNP